MSASSFPFFSVKRSFDMRMHAIRDHGQPALPRYSYPGCYMEKHLLNCTHLVKKQLALGRPRTPPAHLEQRTKFANFFFFAFFMWFSYHTFIRQKHVPLSLPNVFYRSGTISPLFTCTLLWNSLPSSLRHPGVDFSRFRNAIATYMGFPVTRRT